MFASKPAGFGAITGTHGLAAARRGWRMLLWLLHIAPADPDRLGRIPGSTGFGDNRPAFALALLLTLPATLAVAHFSYRHVEAPINSWAKRRFQGTRLQPVLTPAASVHVS